MHSACISQSKMKIWYPFKQRIVHTFIGIKYMQISIAVEVLLFSFEHLHFSFGTLTVYKSKIRKFSNNFRINIVPQSAVFTSLYLTLYTNAIFFGPIKTNKRSRSLFKISRNHQFLYNLHLCRHQFHRAKNENENGKKNNYDKQIENL